RRACAGGPRPCRRPARAHLQPGPRRPPADAGRPRPRDGRPGPRAERPAPGRRLATATLNEPSLSLLIGATVVAAFVVGFLKTSVSAGTGLVLTSTLSLVLPAPIVLGLISPLMLMSDPI